MPPVLRQPVGDRGQLGEADRLQADASAPASLVRADRRLRVAARRGRQPRPRLRRPRRRARDLAQLADFDAGRSSPRSTPRVSGTWSTAATAGARRAWLHAIARETIVAGGGP
jgi:hypothetical protein